MARLGVLAIVLLTLGACATGPTTPQSPTAMLPPVSPEQEFINRAATGTGNEVELGRLAQERGYAPSVRAFGAHIANEHARAHAGVIALARRLNLAPNATMADISGLAVLSGPEFDRQFIADQVKDQREALGLFEGAAQTVQDPRLRRFAHDWLGMLRRDLQRAETIATGYGVGAVAALPRR